MSGGFFSELDEAAPRRRCRVEINATERDKMFTTSEKDSDLPFHQKLESISQIIMFSDPELTVLSFKLCRSANSSVQFPSKALHMSTICPGPSRPVQPNKGLI